MNEQDSKSGPLALLADEVPAVEVGPGCWRRDLPGAGGVRAWIVDMAAGSQWPHVDVHDGAEQVYVVHGDLIEGNRTFGPGTYVYFEPGSSHQPRTETGVRLFGINTPPSRNGA